MGFVRHAGERPAMDKREHLPTHLLRGHRVIDKRGVERTPHAAAETVDLVRRARRETEGQRSSARIEPAFDAGANVVPCDLGVEVERGLKRRPDECTHCRAMYAMFAST